MNKFILILPWLCFSFSLSGAEETTSIGGRAAGMSGASVAHKDIFSIFNNQAGLASIDKISFEGYYESWVNIPLGIKSLGIIYPTNSGTFGLIFTNFGQQNSMIQRLGIAYGKNLGSFFSAGLELEYYGLALPGPYSIPGTFIFEGGIITTPVPNLSIGAHFFNPLRIQLQGENSIPTVMRTGLEYTFEEKVTTAIEFEKSIDYPANLKIGFDYNFQQNLFLRFGGASAPRQFSVGFGVAYLNIKSDIAFSYSSELYSSLAHISFCYSFK